MAGLQGIVASLSGVEALLKKLIGTAKWKGNFAPATEHFVQDSIKWTGAVDVSNKRLDVAVTFDEVNGTSHFLTASMRYDQPGTSGGDDVITFDGVEVANDDFIVHPVVGIEAGGHFYVRLVAEFRFVLNGIKYDVRFDGPV